MCGIAGYIDLRQQSSSEVLAQVVDRMRDSIAYRGPDYAQSWVDERVGVALGHRRLSILDLSPTGRQPMHSLDGRYVIIFNGEIFNFLDIRATLESKGYAFRGGSDTEVMLGAFCEWGVRRGIELLNGEFAFAVWDRKDRALTLARDRLGVKPLYYGWVGGSFVFASELKPFRFNPAFTAEIDRDAAALMLRYNYIPAPYSIYKGIRKLPPGACLTLALNASDRPLPEPYWCAQTAARHGLEYPFAGTADEAVCALDELLSDAVAIRMVADVPLGAFLSGGVDSSTVVALMQRQSRIPVKTFSIGFHDAKYDEAGYARAVAQHLGTEHTELYIDPADVLSLIPRLPQLYDEPFSDSSQIPTYLVSELTRHHVTVSLSGDGGDELFSGYNHFFNTLSLDSIRSRVPPPLRIASAALLDKVPLGAWKVMRAMLPNRYKEVLTGRRLCSLGGLMRQDSFEALYREMLSTWKTEVVPGAHDLSTPLTDTTRWVTNGNRLDWMQSIEMIQFLPDDILVKVDRASMAVSLEARVPLLDYRVVEFAWTLPQTMKVRDGVRKWILKQVLYRYVPEGLIDRPKKGFGVPIDSWLRSDLRPWAAALLNEDRLRSEGFIDPGPVMTRWREHLSGSVDWGYYLWNVLMFEAWLEAQSRCEGARPTSQNSLPVSSLGAAG